MRGFRPIALAVALTLVTVSCAAPQDQASVVESPVEVAESTAGVADEATTQSPAPDEDPMADGTGDSEPVTAEPVSDRPPPDPDRAIAPDFSLELADGTTYALAEEVRPVFMVFWAEW